MSEALSYQLSVDSGFMTKTRADSLKLASES